MKIKNFLFRFQQALPLSRKHQCNIKQTPSNNSATTCKTKTQSPREKHLSYREDTENHHISQQILFAKDKQERKKKRTWWCTQYTVFRRSSTSETSISKQKYGRRSIVDPPHLIQNVNTLSRIREKVVGAFHMSRIIHSRTVYSVTLNFLVVRK